MQIFSWPKPPKMRSTEPPEIPDEFTVYGVRYRVTGGIPRMVGVEEKPLDKEEAMRLIEESFRTFTELLDTPYDRDELISRIRAIHEELNRMLNAARDEEIYSELKRIRNRHIDEKNRLIQDIKNITRASRR
jgi:hypothetical protein